MKTNIITFFLAGFLFAACNPTPEIDDLSMLDGDQIFDLSLTQPEKYLVSEYLPNPSEVQKDIPVLIAAHGYSASTFEWDEMREYADSKGTFLVSQVLLGGHGRSYADFKAASWKDWQASVVDEFNKLHSKGFRNIYLVGSSTGAPLILQMISEGFFSSQKAPKGIFMVDPIVVSSNKTLTLVGVLGPVLGYTTTDLDDGETGKMVCLPASGIAEAIAATDRHYAQGP
jgi:carboxylesterase